MQPSGRQRWELTVRNAGCFGLWRRFVRPGQSEIDRGLSAVSGRDEGRERLVLSVIHG